MPRFNTDGLSERQFSGDIVTRHLKPSPAIERRVWELVHRAGNPGCRVGVHVWATHEAAAQKGKVPLAQYFRIVDGIIDEKVCRVFLATDNALVEQAFRGRYRDVISLAKWFASPGDPLHLNPVCPDPARATEDAVVDDDCARSFELPDPSQQLLVPHHGRAVLYRGEPDRLKFIEPRSRLTTRLRGASRRLWQALSRD